MFERPKADCESVERAEDRRGNYLPPNAFLQST
jgi:hypothetical protein